MAFFYIIISIYLVIFTAHTLNLYSYIGALSQLHCLQVHNILQSPGHLLLPVCCHARAATPLLCRGIWKSQKDLARSHIGFFTLPKLNCSCGNCRDDYGYAHNVHNHMLSVYMYLVHMVGVSSKIIYLII